MSEVTATEAKNRFGQMLEMAQREPVRIQKGDREVAVLVSSERFRALETAEQKLAENPVFEKLLARSIKRRKSLYEALAR